MSSEHCLRASAKLRLVLHDLRTKQGLHGFHRRRCTAESCEVADAKNSEAAERAGESVKVETPEGGEVVTGVIYEGVVTGRRWR